MQNVSYTEYDLATGAILRVAQCSTGKLAPPMLGEGRIFESSDPRTDMVVDGKIVTRNTFDVTATRVGNQITLTNVPHGAVITTEYGQIVMDDSGVLELSVDQSIPLEISLSHKLYTTEVLNLES